MSDQTGPLEYDVTIVGGGVAGCYVAYRLLHGEIDPSSALGQLKQNNGGKLSVGLFEYSGRVGGRLLSAQLPDAPKTGDENVDYLQYTEFGGFRFQPQMHIVRDLATLLELTHQPFPVDEPQNNPVLLRGKRYLKGELSGKNATATESYNLLPLELAIVQGEYADYGTPDLDTYVANQAFAGVLPNEAVTLPAGAPADLANNGWFCLQQRYADAFRKEEWPTVSKLQKQYEEVKQKAVFAGRRFIDWPWWGLRSYLLSGEAIAFEEDSGGYNSLYSSGNGPQGIIENYYFSNQVTDNDYTNVGNPLHASVCFPYEKYADAGHPCTNTVWKHVSEGYAAIPNQLYEGFLANGGNIPREASEHTDHLNRQLLSFTKLDGGYELTFFKRESNQAVTTAQAWEKLQLDPTAGEVVRTKYLILAMPKHSLDLLAQDSFFFRNRTVQQLLNTVIRIPAQRLFMAYPSPWWENAQEVGPDGKPVPAPTCGRSTTNLPVRQFYYWLSSKENGPSIVLASYTNGRAEEYWRGLQTVTDRTFDDLPGSRLPSDLAQPYTPDKLAAASVRGRGPRAATEAMAELAHKQLMAVVGVTDAPEPIYAHYQDWSVDPWGAGWHAWMAGSNSDEIIPRVMQALPDENVFICGEAWSNVQGWVQGALNTSETLLQTKLGLAWPTWLQRGGTWLGPGSNS